MKENESKLDMRSQDYNSPWYEEYDVVLRSYGYISFHYITDPVEKYTQRVISKLINSSRKYKKIKS